VKDLVFVLFLLFIPSIEPGVNPGMSV